MNIDQQLASLHSALDDVLDLERGLADAVLPRAHAELVTGLDNALDLEAGLAQVVAPATGPPQRVLDGFTAFADGLSLRPAAERLATRAWLPVGLLVDAYVFAKHVPTVHAVADEINDPESGVVVLDSARMDVRRVIHDLRLVDVRFSEVGKIAHLLMDTLTRSTREARMVARSDAQLLRAVFDERLAALLMEIDGRAHGSILTQGIHSGLVDVAFADALLRPLSQLISALTNVVGADLTSADLDGLPLDGVRWSSDTRWPEDWEAWVRDNSVPVSADVFEIRSGKAGSQLPT